MATVLSICNSALIKLGANTITSIDQNSKEAILCKAQYPIVLTRVLQEHPWNFAIKRASLQKLADAPAFGFQAQFQLPPDYLRVLTPYPETVKFVVEGDKVLCDEANLSIRYLFNAEDPSKYPPQFAEVFAYELALELSYALVQSNTQQAQLANMAKNFKLTARTYDAQEGSPEDFFRDEWDAARY